METKSSSEASPLKIHTGGCHCGAVRYQVEVDATHGTHCNCTICVKTASTNASVKPATFKLLHGRENLSQYVWGHKVSTRYFCKLCGIHCYGDGDVAEMGGAFLSVNLNTLDDFELLAAQITHWDGRHDNWQAGTREVPWPVGSTAQRTAVA